MTIAELVDYEVMRHLSLYGCIKKADPMVQHLVKTSETPLLRFRRWWMRKEALKQCQEATVNQGHRNAELASHPHPKGLNGRLNASIEPWFFNEMRNRHKTEWNDPDFLGYVKREDPEIFPKRDG